MLHRKIWIFFYFCLDFSFWTKISKKKIQIFLCSKNGKKYPKKYPKKKSRKKSKKKIQISFRIFLDGRSFYFYFGRVYWNLILSIRIHRLISINVFTVMRESRLVDVSSHCKSSQMVNQCAVCRDGKIKGGRWRRSRL